MQSLRIEHHHPSIIIDDPVPLVRPRLAAAELYVPSHGRPTIEGAFEWPSATKKERRQWKALAYRAYLEAERAHGLVPKVVTCLIERMADAGASCIRTQEQLAWEIGCCVRTVRNGLCWLEDRGLITWWWQRGRHQGRSVRRSNIYKLILDAKDSLIAVARGMARPIWRARHEKAVAERRSAEHMSALAQAMPIHLSQGALKRRQEAVDALLRAGRKPAPLPIYTTLGTACEADAASASTGNFCPGTLKEEGRKKDPTWDPPFGDPVAQAQRMAEVQREQSQRRARRTAEGLRARGRRQ